MAGRRMPKRKDIKVFKKTYAKTKKINHGSAMQPNGIRF